MAEKNNAGFYRKWTFIIIIIGIILRFGLALPYAVSGDACWQFSAARFLADNGHFPLFEPLGRQEPFWPPPLFHIMAAFMYSAFGFFWHNAGEFGMKMLSPLLGSFTLVFVYLINRKLFDEKVAFYSMLFTAFIPIFIDYHVFGYIDGAITLFTVMSIYFALDGRYIKSAVAAGLCAMTKYNGIFILPLLLYITYKKTKNNKAFLKKVFVIFAILLVMAAPWFARNYIHFGNPFWPFMNFMFGGIKTGSFESADFHTFEAFSPLNIFDIRTVTFTYLAIFGVPDGDYRNISFFSLPYMNFLFPAWLIGTLIFILPFAKGFSIGDKTKRNILLIWFLSYLAVMLLYIINVSYVATRFLLPAIPVLGMVYGVGFSRIKFTNEKFKKMLHALILLMIVGFIFTSALKITLASREWSRYNADFAWVKENTSKNSVIIPGRQCLSYHLNRGTLDPKIENLKKADYIWENLNFNLEKRSIVPAEILNTAKDKGYNKVYENKKTETSVYKINQ